MTYTVTSYICNEPYRSETVANETTRGMALDIAASEVPAIAARLRNSKLIDKIVYSRNGEPYMTEWMNDEFTPMLGREAEENFNNWLRMTGRVAEA